MKILTSTFLKKVNPAEINYLTKEIKETLDIEMKTNSKKVFTTMDMWNINKQRRTFNTRRSLS